MRGINVVCLSGNLTGYIKTGETGGGHGFCSFSLVSEQKGGRTTLVRVNVFADGLVKMCEPRLRKGDYLVISGELMNQKDSRMLEVRALEIIFDSAVYDEVDEEKL